MNNNTQIDKYEYRQLGDFQVNDTIHYIGGDYKVTAKLCTSDGYVTLLATVDGICGFPVIAGSHMVIQLAVKRGS